MLIVPALIVALPGVGVTCIAPAPAGDVAAFGLSDGRIEIMDVSTGQRRAGFAAAGGIDRLFWCGPRLLSAATDGLDPARKSRNTLVWESWDLNGSSSTAVRKAAQYENTRDAIPSPDGTRLLIIEAGGKARVCSTVDLRELCAWAGPFGSGCWSKDGSNVLLSTYGGSIQVLDPASRDVLHDESTHMRSVHSMAMDAKGRLLVAGGEDMVVHVYDSPTWKRSGTWSSVIEQAGDWCGFQSIVLAPTGDVAWLMTGEPWSIQAWSLESNACVWRIQEECGYAWPSDFVLSPDGSRLAFSHPGRALRILDARDGRTTASFALLDLQNGRQALAWTADGQFLIVGNRSSGNAVVFDGRKLRPLSSLVPTAGGLQRREFERPR